MTRYLIFFGAILFIVSSCQADKEAASQKDTFDDPTKSVSAPVNAQQKHCFKIDQANDEKELILLVSGDKLTGSFSINNGQAYEGAISGVFRGDDIITDFNYEIDGKKHHEKMILTFDAQQARVARSTSVLVDGERQPRNGGNATMDIIPRIACD